MTRMLKTALLALGIASLGFAGTASADTTRYGMSGCGLGSLLWGDDPGALKQILGSTTNGTFGNQTFGITSGTSNCKPQGGAAGVAMFVEANREAIAKDISRGNGETVASLAQLGGCADSKAVGAKLQANFGRIFPSAAASDKAVSQTIVQVLSADGTLSCQSLL